MNIEDVKEYINKINALDAVGDYESAHSLEDDMLWDFVRFIAALDNEYSVEQSIAEEMVIFVESSDAPRYFS